MKNTCFALLLCAASLNGFCQGGETTHPSYNLASPEVITLPDRIREVSGIAYNSNDNSIYAVSDDFGRLYNIPLTDTSGTKFWEFYKNKDFEGLAAVGGRIYALTSNGTIVSFTFRDYKVTDVREHVMPAKADNDFESLYYDAAAKKLVMICKDCDADQFRAISVYTFDPATDKFDKAPYIINPDKAMEGQQRNKFEPSDAAIHPVTGEVYVLSSRNQRLMVTDKSGTMIASYVLDEELFKQPEGIAFTPAGDMLISNEHAGRGQANILIFRYKK